jgi:hypothetical protein
MPSGALKFSDPRGLDGFAEARDVRTQADRPAGTVSCQRPAEPDKGQRAKYRRDNVLDGSTITASFRSA